MADNNDNDNPAAGENIRERADVGAIIVAEAPPARAGRMDIEVTTVISIIN